MLVLVGQVNSNIIDRVRVSVISVDVSVDLLLGPFEQRGRIGPGSLGNVFADHTEGRQEVRQDSTVHMSGHVLVGASTHELEPCAVEVADVRVAPGKAGAFAGAADVTSADHVAAANACGHALTILALSSSAAHIWCIAWIRWWCCGHC